MIESRGGRFHLYPELCDDNFTNLCSSCHQSLTGNKIPAIRIASGYDIGNPERAGLPQLSFAGELCITRSRILSSALRVQIPYTVDKNGQYPSFKGHCIAFPDTASDICAQQMPDEGYINRNIIINS